MQLAEARQRADQRAGQLVAALIGAGSKNIERVQRTLDNERASQEQALRRALYPALPPSVQVLVVEPVRSVRESWQTILQRYPPGSPLHQFYAAGYNAYLAQSGRTAPQD